MTNNYHSSVMTGRAARKGKAATGSTGTASSNAFDKINFTLATLRYRIDSSLGGILALLAVVVLLIAGELIHG